MLCSIKKNDSSGDGGNGGGDGGSGSGGVNLLSRRQAY